MLSLVFILGLVLLIIVFSKRQPQGTRDFYIRENNQQWMDYLDASKNIAQKPAEKALLARLLSELMAAGMPSPRQSQSTVQPQSTENVSEATAITTSSSASEEVPIWNGADTETVPVFEQPRQNNDLDTETLLLYFGAFLFVAAAGLFVGFGTANGSIRLGVVLTVMMLMYTGGLWLFRNRPKLKIAGLTFVGIGLMLAPLAGVAAYSFLFRDQPEVVWFVTSLLCLGLYAHALRTLRNPLLEYVFLGTFLSLFESMISVIDAPAYYFGWMLAAFGLGLQALSMWRGWKVSPDQPTTVTSQLLLPAAVVVALFLTPEYGYVQLAVSATLAATYYLLAAIQSQAATRESFAVASHILYLSAVSLFAYAYQNEWSHVSLALLVVGGIQTIAYAALRVTSLTHAAATITMVALITATACAWQEPVLMLASVVLLMITSASLWLRQERADGYLLAAWALAGAPIIYALGIAEPTLTLATMAWLVAATLLVQLAAIYTTQRQTAPMADWRITMQLAYVTVLIVAGVMALMSGGWVALALCGALALTTIALVEYDDRSFWLGVGGITLFMPLFVVWENSAVFLVATMFGLLWNIVLALRYRLEINRWLGTILWVLLPLAMAHQWTNELWNATYFAVSYTIVVVGLLLARAIATGRILQSVKVPMVSYMQTASMSYVVGYLVAGFVAIAASIAGPRFLPAAIALALASLAYITCIKIERNTDGLAVIPLLLQVGLWGTYESATENEAYIVLSTILAVTGYLFARTWQGGQGLLNRRAVAQASVILAYVAPSTALVFDQSWAMPLGLLVAGLITLDISWRQPQANRELAGAVSIAAILWWMQYLGVTNLQAYTHVVALAFGLYAYWRNQRGEKEQSQQYIVFMLLTASVPLALQAMAGGGGGTYGWWFLFEQIGIMLLGLAINNRFVTRWGLYASVFAVLYQLRNLGWALLSVLAIFIIGMALYRLQGKDDNGPSSNKSPQDK